MRKFLTFILSITSFLLFEGIITQARGSNGIFSGKCIMRVSNFNILLKSHFDDISINQSYQVTVGRVIADRGPGIMINLDDITEELDSLANINIDTTITNDPDDYLDDLEIVYDIDPVIVTDSIAEDLEEIQDDLQELADSGNLTEEQKQAIEDLLNQIDNLLISKRDKTLYLIISNGSTNIDTLRSGEIMYLPKNSSDTIQVTPYKRKDSYFIADWFINNHAADPNLINFVGSVYLNFILDSIGNFKIKGINIAGNDTTEVEVEFRVVDKPIVNFDKGNLYNGEYGFNKYKFAEFRDSIINDTVYIYDNEYFPSWAALIFGETYSLKAKALIPSLYDDMKIKFESSNSNILQLQGTAEYDKNTLVSGLNELNISLVVTGTTGTDSNCSIFAKDENDNIIGKFIVQSEKKSNFLLHKCELIRVISDSTFLDSINLPVIKTELEFFLNNKSYNQAFVKWEVTKTSTIFVNIDTTLALSAMTLNHTLSQRYFHKLKLHYKNAKNTHYIFLVDKRSSKVRGMATKPDVLISKKPQYVTIFYQAQNKYITYSHELGHNHSLKHPEDEYSSVKMFSTNNIMDWGGQNRNYFWRWQIKKIRKFEFSS